MLVPKYELDSTTRTELSQFLTGYVTLRWTLTFWPWSHVTWCHFGDQSLYQVLTGSDLPFQSLDDYNFLLTASLKSQFLRFFGSKGVRFHLSNPQKALPWRERRRMSCCAWECDQRCDLWAWWRKEKKDRNFHASNWLCA